jgi:hypothetical protein
MTHRAIVVCVGALLLFAADLGADCPELVCGLFGNYGQGGSGGRGTFGGAGHLPAPRSSRNQLLGMVGDRPGRVNP